MTRDPERRGAAATAVLLCAVACARGARLNCGGAGAVQPVESTAPRTAPRTRWCASSAATRCWRRCSSASRARGFGQRYRRMQRIGQRVGAAGGGGRGVLPPGQTVHPSIEITRTAILLPNGVRGELRHRQRRQADARHRWRRDQRLPRALGLPGRRQRAARAAHARTPAAFRPPASPQGVTAPTCDALEHARPDRVRRARERQPAGVRRTRRRSPPRRSSAAPEPATASR